MHYNGITEARVKEMAFDKFNAIRLWPWSAKKNFWAVYRQHVTIHAWRWIYNKVCNTIYFVVHWNGQNIIFSKLENCINTQCVTLIISGKNYPTHPSSINYIFAIYGPLHQFIHYLLLQKMLNVTMYFNDKLCIRLM